MMLGVFIPRLFHEIHSRTIRGSILYEPQGNGVRATSMQCAIQETCIGNEALHRPARAAD